MAFSNVNWGNVGAWAGIVLSAISSVGYFFAGDVRRGLYFFFAVCITTCIVWK